MTSEARNRSCAILLYFVVSVGEGKGGSQERWMTYDMDVGVWLQYANEVAKSKGAEICIKHKVLK